jgi:hypothetical protein
LPKTIVSPLSGSGSTRTARAPRDHRNRSGDRPRASLRKGLGRRGWIFEISGRACGLSPCCATPLGCSLRIGLGCALLIESFILVPVGNPTTSATLWTTGSTLRSPTSARSRLPPSGAPAAFGQLCPARCPILLRRRALVTTILFREPKHVKGRVSPEDVGSRRGPPGAEANSTDRATSKWCCEETVGPLTSELKT